MVRFRKPSLPFWLSPPDDQEIDFHLKDVIRNYGQFIENLTPCDCEKYTTFLNKDRILHVWNTVTQTTIPLPSIVFDTAVNSTRQFNAGRRSSVEEIYRVDYGFNINFPYSPLVYDALGRYHPIEVCAFRMTKCQQQVL